MKVLLLCRHSRMGASSRLRSLQYIPFLEANGMDITAAPLLGDRYLAGLYSGKGRRLGLVMAAYARRLKALTAAGQYDLLWIEKELFPWFPAWLEQWLALCRIPYIVDYDDATFHTYDQHRNPLLRRLFGHKIDRVMEGARLVTAGNDYLAERARRAGAARVEMMPSVVDLDRYPIAAPSPHDVFTIGWIGTPMTSKFVRLVEPALAEICEGGRARVVLAGSGPMELPGVPLEIRPWTEEGEVRDLQSFDVGIMPLADEPWERGKCSYKLIQYMACGKPVVASPIGNNREVVQDGENGFLAEGHAAWVRALELLRSQPEHRRLMGQSGRTMVQSRYCLQVTAPRLLQLMNSVIRRPS